MRCHFTISHVPGKDLVIADTLSRAPAGSSLPGDHTLQDEAAACMSVATDSLPASDERLSEFADQQTADPQCSAIATYCREGWPVVSDLPEPLKPYWPKRGEITISHDGLLLCGPRIVVPAPLRLQVLEQLHVGHQGITKSRQRAKQSVWWPGLNSQLDQYIRNCHTCTQNQTHHTEPLIPTPLPSLTWQKVGADFFEHESKTYLLLVDYYSRFIEVCSMSAIRLRHIPFDSCYPSLLVADCQKNCLLTTACDVLWLRCVYGTGSVYGSVGYSSRR